MIKHFYPLRQCPFDEFYITIYKLSVICIFVCFQVKDGCGRVVVMAGGHMSSGVPYTWRADANKSGVNYVEVNSPNKTVKTINELIGAKKSGDVIVYSIHWGSNWGWDLEEGQREFAHRLIDEAGVDVIHGHSSHHIKGVEMYKKKLIIYGCGDFISDYEGISSSLSIDEGFRDDLSFMYFAEVDPPTGNTKELRLAPMRLKVIYLLPI